MMGTSLRCLKVTSLWYWVQVGYKSRVQVITGYDHLRIVYDWSYMISHICSIIYGQSYMINIYEIWWYNSRTWLWFSYMITLYDNPYMMIRIWLWIIYGSAYMIQHIFFHVYDHIHESYMSHHILFLVYYNIRESYMVSVYDSHIWLSLIIIYGLPLRWSCRINKLRGRHFVERNSMLSMTRG